MSGGGHATPAVLDPALQTSSQSAAVAAEAAAAFSAAFAPPDHPSKSPLENRDRSSDGGQSAHGEGDGTEYDTLQGFPGDAGEGPGPEDAKRPRACESCRGLKVRCVPDPTDPDGPCARCKKARRNCVVTLPTRKRQKKTDSRVAELEKKIDALTASLHARATGVALPALSTQTVPDVAGNQTQDQAEPTRRSLATAADEFLAPPPAVPHPLGRQDIQPPLAGQKRKISDRYEGPAEPGTRFPPLQARSGEDYEDVIGKGILSPEKASELLARYNDQMVRHLPAVILPPGMTVSEFRASKPVLFLAVMAAAASESSNLQRQLVRELMQIFAEKVVITGEKSLELVQALHVAVIWYWPPEHFEELKFYQLVHMSVVMALDIGLGRRTPGRESMPYGNCGFPRSPFRRTEMPDPTALESRRTWLCCYLLATNTAMALHRPLLLRWTKFMAESTALLRSSPEAAPFDQYLCALIEAHRLSEEIGAQFTMDDPEETVNINESRTLFALRKLEHDLDAIRQATPKELMQPTLQFTYGIVSLYMHEIVLNADSGQDLAMGPGIFRGEETMAPHPLATTSATTAHLNAISSCLTAIDTIIDTFLAMSVSTIRCLPVFNLVRVAYALVVLIRIYFSSANPGTKLNAVINKEDMRVEYYLDSLLEKFRVTSADDKSRPAGKFLVVLVMLKGWYLRQHRRGGEGAGASANNGRSGAIPTTGSTQRVARQTPNPPDKNTETSGDVVPDSTQQTEQEKRFSPAAQQQQHHQQQQQRQMGAIAANTPLHLLSEIATNDRNRPPPPSHEALWGIPSRTPNQPFAFDANTQGTNTTTASGPSPSSGSGLTDTGTVSTVTPADPVLPFPAASEAPFSTDISAFNMSHLTENLSIEELAASLGLSIGMGNFPPTGASGAEYAPPGGYVPTPSEEGQQQQPGGGPNDVEGGVNGAGNFSQGVRWVMANDPWFGQWGQVIDSMPQSGPQGSGGTWGAPPFQM